jgi:hypothetical protein
MLFMYVIFWLLFFIDRAPGRDRKIVGCLGGDGPRRARVFVRSAAALLSTLAFRDDA